MNKQFIAMVLTVCVAAALAQGARRPQRTMGSRRLACPAASKTQKPQLCVVLTNGVEWTYEVRNGAVVLGSENSMADLAVPEETSGMLAIPDAINGMPVRSIGSCAFWGCTNLTAVTIPSSVVNIGESAFGCCRGLKQVTIPSSVTNIGESAFGCCSALPSVALPSNVTSIKTATFSGCGRLTSVMIPSSVTNIEASAFACCSNLTSVMIPPSVVNIGKAAFFPCDGIKTIKIPSSVANIDNQMAFAGRGLMSFDVDSDSPFYSSRNGLLCSKDGLTLLIGVNGDVKIPLGITHIGGYAFYLCSGLTSVTIPSSVKCIGNYAFSFCHELKSVTIPSSVTNIGFCAFWRCPKLKSVSVVKDGKVESVPFDDFAKQWKQGSPSRSRNGGLLGVPMGQRLLKAP